MVTGLPQRQIHKGLYKAICASRKVAGKRLCFYKSFIIIGEIELNRLVFSALTLSGDFMKTDHTSAEKAMFRATGGVNTHKGIIFSMGLLAAAAD